MSQEVQFGNKIITEPGSYSRTVSGVKNPSPALSYGNIVIIDTNSGATWSGGAGVSGTLKKNKKALMICNDIAEYRDKMLGGIWWACGEPLFRPNGFGTAGVSKVHIMKAATTVPAEISFTLDDGDGSVSIYVNDEGIIGNGVLNAANIPSKGYSAKWKAGPNAGSPVNTFVIDFYRGAYRGVDFNGIPYDNISSHQAIAEVICSSVEFTTIDQLVSWMKTNTLFQKYFTYKISTAGTATAADLATYVSYTVATGGTETYSTANLVKCLEVIKDLDYTFVLADNWGVKGTSGVPGYPGANLSPNNILIQAHLIEEAKFQKYMFVGGGLNEDEFSSMTGSIVAAGNYDSSRVVLVHAGMKKLQKSGSMKIYESIYKTAAVLGRVCGLAPQTPVTFKEINMDEDCHDMTTKERVLALQSGVLHTKYDDEFGAFIINQGITTNLENDFLLNEDGTSHEISIERISAQVNKILQVDSKRELFGGEEGPNRNILSESVVLEWTKNKLASLVAKPSKDNLIISYQEVTIKTQGDSYFINYGFEPNFPVNKMFYTGTMLDNTSQSI